MATALAVYIYIYMVPPQKKPMFTSLLLVFAIFCVYFGLPFDPCFFFFGGGTIYIYILVHVGCMTSLSTLEGMQSECVECIQNAFLPNTKTKIQDLHRSCVENLGNTKTKIQDLHRSLVENLGNTKTKIQDLENLGNTKTKIQDLHRSLVENLGNTKVQDPFPRFSTRLLCKSWILVLVFPRFSKSWILVLVFPRFSTRLANLGSWSWYWAGMHSLAFSGSDKIALSTVWSWNITDYRHLFLIQF